MTSLSHREPPPSPTEATLARISGQRLAAFAERRRSLTVRVVDAEQGPLLELPAGAVALLMDILGAMAAGRGVTLMPENADLTTVEAAGILNVSRPFLIKLLEEGKIPYRKTGTHRRIRMEDIMTYKAKIDAEREGVLDQLVADAQAQDMGYRRG